jgi:uncharacterized protein
MILDQISKDLKEALVKRDSFRLSTLKLLMAGIQNKEIELRAKQQKITEESVFEVLKKEAKKRKEAIVLYEKGGRMDLADKEKNELKILTAYLPQELSDEEIKNIIRKKIDELGAGINFGKLMGEVMKEVAGRADGQKISGLVKEELARS